MSISTLHMRSSVAAGCVASSLWRLTLSHRILDSRTEGDTRSAFRVGEKTSSLVDQAAGNTDNGACSCCSTWQDAAKAKCTKKNGKYCQTDSSYVCPTEFPFRVDSEQECREAVKILDTPFDMLTHNPDEFDPLGCWLYDDNSGKRRIHWNAEKGLINSCSPRPHRHVICKQEGEKTFEEGVDPLKGCTCKNNNDGKNSGGDDGDNDEKAGSTSEGQVVDDETTTLPSKYKDNDFPVNTETTTTTTGAGGKSDVGDNSKEGPPPGEDIIAVNDFNCFADKPDAYSGSDNALFIKNLIKYNTSLKRKASKTVVFNVWRSKLNSGPYIKDSLFNLRKIIHEEGYQLKETKVNPDEVESDVKVIFFWTPTKEFSDRAIYAYQKFASEGGRIILIGEHVDYYGQIGVAAANHFFSAMGAKMENAGDHVGQNYIATGDKINHPHQLVEGLNKFKFFDASSLNLGPHDHALIRVQDNKAVIAVAHINWEEFFKQEENAEGNEGAEAPEPGGDIITINDFNCLSDAIACCDAFTDSDNEQFAKNLINFNTSLQRGKSKTVMFNTYATLLTKWLGQLTTLRKIIEAQGFKIVDTAENPETVDPDVKVIFFWTPAVTFPESAIKAYKNFAKEGGRIILIGEHYKFYGPSGVKTANTFFQAMGAKMENAGDTVAVDYVVKGENIGSHQLVKGVNKFKFFAASSLVMGRHDYALFYSENGEPIAGVAHIRWDK